MSDFEVKKLFNLMEGNWKIDRTFSSTVQGFDAPEAKGFATFERINPLIDILIYFEKLTLKWENGNTNECHQNYIYEYKDGVISKYQPIKNLEINSETISNHTKMYDLAFCHLNLNNPVNAKGVFQCKHDSYAAQFKFNNSESFSINYSVLGPYKEYNTHSDYTKQAYNPAFKEEVS